VFLVPPHRCRPPRTKHSTFGMGSANQGQSLSQNYGVCGLSEFPQDWESTKLEIQEMPMQTVAISENTAGATTAGSFLGATRRYARERANLIEHCEELQSANYRLRRRRKEFDDELVLAARVQRLLEPKPAAWGRVRVDTFSKPAHTVGGDFGIVCTFDDQHLNLVVGDVSGHGIGAALAANCIYTIASTHLQSGGALADVLTALNRSAMDFDSSNFFFTLAVARLDRAARRMTFAGAGHPPCMVMKPGAIPQLFESRSMMLGALPHAVCAESVEEVDLDPGDRILLYTDGITDVFDERGDMLGVEGLRAFAQESSRLPFDEMLPAILDRIDDWRYESLGDDVTLVLAEVGE
jgi:serine phosphatase RsbU (regulator of sigma subunit)